MTGRTQVPDGWLVARLGDVAEFQQGGTPSKSRPEYWEGDIPFVTGADLREFRISRDNARSFLTDQGLSSGATVICEPGSLLLATRTRVGLVGIASETMGASQDITLVMPRDFADHSYISRVLISYADQLQRTSRGTTIQGVSREDISSLSILLPPLPEQRAIAAVLDSIDDAIERAEEVVAATERLRDALLHELLTRGVPGQHSEWKEAPGIGTIPACWDVVRLGDVAEVRNGTTPSRAETNYWQDGDVPFIKSGQVNDTLIEVPDEFITSQAVASAGAVVVPRGSVLIAMIGQGKTRGMTAQLRIDAAINQNFAAVFGADGDFSLDFFFTWARQNYFHIRALGQGSNQDALNCALIEGMRAPKPSLAEQQTIVAMTNSIHDAIQQARQERNGLQLLKASAADALLTGRVRVYPKADKHWLEGD